MDQFLHLAAQIAVIAAGFGQERGALGRGLFEGGVINVFDPLPAIRTHLSFIVHGPSPVNQGFSQIPDWDWALGHTGY